MNSMAMRECLPVLNGSVKAYCILNIIQRLWSIIDLDHQYQIGI